MKKQQVNIYLPLGMGGPTSWGKQLSLQLLDHGFQAKTYNTLAGYIGQPFRLGITHTTLPFPTAPFLSKKNILTIHGDFYKEETPWTKLYPRAIKTADILTVPSNYLKQALSLGASCRVIPNGINLPTTIKKDYELVGKNVTVGILTNFNFREKAKGVISLAKILSRSSKEVQFLVGGDGYLLSEMKNVILKIYPQTKFLGHCNKDTFFENIDIFTYFSHLDNQPLALIEAMAYGLPVLTNIVGSTEEIMINNLSKFIFKNQEEDAYLDVLEKLAGSLEARKNNGECAMQIAKNYSWEVILPQWIELYNSYN